MKQLANERGVVEGGFCLILKIGDYVLLFVCIPAFAHRDFVHEF